jgi:hypothetical protein
MYGLAEEELKIIELELLLLRLCISHACGVE